jgi:hypothetical protein
MGESDVKEGRVQQGIFGYFVGHIASGVSFFFFFLAGYGYDVANKNTSPITFTPRPTVYTVGFGPKGGYSTVPYPRRRRRFFFSEPLQKNEFFLHLSA